MAHHVHSSDIEQPIAPPQTKEIWTTFWILTGITAVEFIVAFTLHNKGLRLWIFGGMTIIKAAYIIGNFMHLRHEVKSLIWTILMPVVFVVWLLIALIWEGSSVGANVLGH
jgi:cytochrome c oxidase subunit IV